MLNGFSLKQIAEWRQCDKFGGVPVHCGPDEASRPAGPAWPEAVVSSTALHPRVEGTMISEKALTTYENE